MIISLKTKAYLAPTRRGIGRFLRSLIMSAVAALWRRKGVKIVLMNDERMNGATPSTTLYTFRLSENTRLSCTSCTVHRQGVHDFANLPLIRGCLAIILGDSCQCRIIISESLLRNRGSASRHSQSGTMPARWEIMQLGSPKLQGGPRSGRASRACFLSPL